jgi:predicted dehydrogenase
MAMNSQEAREMVEAARTAGVMLGVAHVMRFEESVKWFRQQVTQRQFGAPVMARADFVAPLMSSERTWINDPTLATGGPIADVGVHCIDTLRFVLNDEVKAVTARAHYDSRWVVEASAAMLLEFRSGIMATVSVSALSPYQTVLEIVSESGVISGVNALNVEHPVKLEARVAFDLLETKTVSNQRAYADQVDAFAEAIEQGREFEIPGEEGLKNQLILDAAFRSVKSGKAEAL